jgi:hypothetical protein
MLVPDGDCVVAAFVRHSHRKGPMSTLETVALQAAVTCMYAQHLHRCLLHPSIHRESMRSHQKLQSCVNMT